MPLESHAVVQVAIEYSHNLGPEADIELLARRIARRLCDTSGVFPPASVQVTAHCLTQYVVGDGPGERAFVNITARLGGACPEGLESGYFQSLFDLVTDHLADLYERRSLSIAMWVEESRATAWFEQSNLAVAPA